jgi:hypothetical protein
MCLLEGKRNKISSMQLELEGFKTIDSFSYLSNSQSTDEGILVPALNAAMKREAGGLVHTNAPRPRILPICADHGYQRSTRQNDGEARVPQIDTAVPQARKWHCARAKARP